MTEFLAQNGSLLVQGTLETLYMTLVSTLLAYLIGTPMGVLLTITKPGALAACPRFNGIFSWVVSILRSLPFIILMIFIIPFTRAVVGTSIGCTAAIIPLTLSAAPFVARMVESSLEEVDKGVVEAVKSTARDVHFHHHHLRIYHHYWCSWCRWIGKSSLALWLSTLSK